MIPPRNSKSKDPYNLPLTTKRVTNSLYSKANKGEELINKYSEQSTKFRRLESFYITKKALPKTEKKESLQEFTARFEKKMFCNLSAKEIETIMKDNRRKIEEQY